MTKKQFKTFRRVAKQLHTMADKLWEESVSKNETFAERDAMWFLLENTNNVLQYLWVLYQLGVVKDDNEKSFN